MMVEKQFKMYFNQKVKQIFLYLIDDCNLRCKQCLYKTELTFQLKNKLIPFEEAVNLMKEFYKLGARKITFMGGEPTLYGKLPQLIHEAKLIGYKYSRIDTNGTFESTLLDNPYMKELNEITFSLDGYTREMNDKIRGEGVFEKCVNNIKLAINKGYEVHITTCVHNGLTKKVDDKLSLLKMIKFLKSLGVKKINMHDLFKADIPRDLWSDSIDTTIEEYMEAYLDVLDYKEKTKDNDIRMPQCVTTKDEFQREPKYYGYCSVKQFDRALLFPNGMIRVCSLMIGTPYCVGFFDKNSIYWNTTPTNEINGHKMNIDTPCTNQNKGDKFSNGYVPLCVSFKPKQDEPVWNDFLKWEERRSDNI